jgi:hypothetical protein
MDEVGESYVSYCIPALITIGCVAVFFFAKGSIQDQKARWNRTTGNTQLVVRRMKSRIVSAG